MKTRKGNPTNKKRLIQLQEVLKECIASIERLKELEKSFEKKAENWKELYVNNTKKEKSNRTFRWWYDPYLGGTIQVIENSFSVIPLRYSVTEWCFNELRRTLEDEIYCEERGLEEDPNEL